MNRDELIKWLKVQRKLYKASIHTDDPKEVFRSGYRCSPLYKTGKIDMIDIIVDHLKRQDDETSTIQ